MAVSKSPSNTRIWDIWIRVFHWLLVFSVCFLLFSGQTGYQFFEWHRRVGEFVLALLLFRCVWGFVGSSNARLHNLMVNPVSSISHIAHLIRGRVPQERGHNAAGGWAVLLMLFLILFQAVSGLFIADEDELIEGAFYGLVDYSLSERLLQLHYLNAKALILLLAVHVLMVFLYLFRAGQNLITPMITGKMKWHNQEQELPLVQFRHPLVGLLLISLCLGLCGYFLKWYTNL